MNKKLLSIFSAWIMALMLFAFMPMANAQNIGNVAIVPVTQVPGEEVVVTLTVTGFDDADDYNYYVVYNYADYDKLLRFGHNQTTNIDKTLVAGDGIIEITATVPIEVYRYGAGELTVLVVDDNGDLVYQLEDQAFDYPPGGLNELGGYNFENYNLEPRILESPVFYEFDAGTSFSFTLVRNNPEPYATGNVVRVQYKKGAGPWTLIRQLDLNSPGLELFTSADTDWPAGIEGEDISVRIIQVDGDDYHSGIKTWSVQNFTFNGVIGEPTEYDEIWNHFFVKDLVNPAGHWFPIANNFTFIAPAFEITDFNVDDVDIYPGVQVKYEITSGANVAFPTGTNFEVFLSRGGEEYLVGTFALAEMPAATVSKEFQFRVPFRVGDWDLNVRADLRDDFVAYQWEWDNNPAKPFTINNVNLIAAIDLDETPAAQKFELDGITYLFPGSTVHVDYELGVDQTILTSGVQVVLEFNDGSGWAEMSRKAYSNTPAQQFITGSIPVAGQVVVDDIAFRLRLYYGEDLEFFTDLDRSEIGNNANVDETPIDTENDFNGTWDVGTQIGFSIFVKNTVAQSLVIEYIHADQPVWQVLGTKATTAAQDGYALHFAIDFYDLVPAGELTVTDPRVRVRWADGAPLGENKALYKSGRILLPYDHYLNIQTGLANVNILYPYLTLSNNVQGNYIFADEEDSIEIAVDYYHYAMPTGTQIAVVLIEEGNNPANDPYLYLGSKAIPAASDQDSQTFTVTYEEIFNVFGDLPQLPDPADEYDVWLFAADKDAADPIMFAQTVLDFDWKENDDEQPIMITTGENIIGYDEPLYLEFNWIVTTPISPWISQTMPVVQYTIDEGMTWTTIEEIDLPNSSEPGFLWEIDQVEYDDILSENTRFRWYQYIESGDWTVTDVKLLSGEFNLVTFEYKETGIPQNIFLALDEEEVIVVGPCDEFDEADLYAYLFTPDTTTVASGGSFEFDWEFRREDAKAEPAIGVVGNEYYIHGENLMDFDLVYTVDTKLEEVVLTFPTGVVPNSAEVINVVGNTLTPAVAGQVITYTADAGVIVGAIDVIFEVTFTVAETVNDAIEVEFEITDAAGTEEGAFQIHPAMQFPEGTVFTFWMDGEVIAETTETGTFTAHVPATTTTGAYDIVVTAELEVEGEPNCEIGPIFAFGPMFVITDPVVDVYEIEVLDVHVIDPDEDLYWGKEADVEFQTFGPWQDFEDLRFEVVLKGVTPEYKFQQDFEAHGYNNLPPDWTNLDEDGDGVFWHTFDWFTAPTGSLASMISLSWHPALGAMSPDNWAITPQINIDEDDYMLSFWFVTNWAENYSVYVSTTGDDPADFIAGDIIHTETCNSCAWNQVELSLAAYDGQDIYIAFRHHDVSDQNYIGIDMVEVYREEVGYINIGNIAHVAGENYYMDTFTLPTFEEVVAADITADIEETDFEVEIRAYTGEGAFVFGKTLETIDEFYLLGGTEQETTPLTFDDEASIRYAITNKVELEQYEDLEVYLQFTYSADIKAPNFLTLPILQVTMDNGITYSDIEVPGSAFAAQNRLDAQALNKVYQYQIDAEYLTDDTRFRWYQEVPDGVWSIDNVVVTLITNEVPLANYLINDPPYEITIIEEPDFCDQFDEDILAEYIWELEDVDPITGFDAPVIAGEEFGFTWEFNEASVMEELPDDTEFLFFVSRKAVAYKQQTQQGNVDPRLRSHAHFISMDGAELLTSGEEKFTPATTASKDDDGEWITWDNGVYFTSIGTGAAATFDIASRWYPEDLEDYEEKQISSIRVIPARDDAAYTLKIWVGEDLEEVYSQEVTQALVVDEWNEVELTIPYIMDVNDIVMFGFNIVTPDGFPAGTDSGPAIAGKGDMIRLDEWVSMANTFGLSYNWMLQAYVEDVTFYMINIDNEPYTMADAPFTAMVPEIAKTGIYNVYAMAYIYDEEKDETTVCVIDATQVKEDILVINNETGPEDVHSLLLEGLYYPLGEEDDDEDYIPRTSFIVGDKYEAVYSTYGKWPEDMNFAAVYAGNILATGQDTGEGIVFEDLQMPYIPYETELLESIDVDDSPGQYAYDSNTWTELGWEEFTAAETGVVSTITIELDWLTDQWFWEGSLWLRSPEGKEVMVAEGLPTGSHTINVADFAGASLSGDWRIWIQDSFSDGGHQATNINVSFYSGLFNIYTYFGDELILSEIEINLDTDDFEKEGYNENDNLFDAEGNRWATTPVIDLAGLDASNSMLIFNYINTNVTQSAATLPVLQVSTNGGSTFTDILHLTDTDQYEVSINTYLSENVMFRWIQPANYGEGFDRWNISDVVITSGENNIYYRSNSIAVAQVIPQVAPPITADYTWQLAEDGDLEQAVYAGSTFTYIWARWTGANAYPDGTIFTIELHKDGEIVLDNETGEPVVIQNSGQTGTSLTATAPMVERGVYDVYVKAHYDGYMYDQGIVAALRIFNPVLKTELVGLDVPYAGGFADFVGSFESNLNQNLNSSYWYNLILTENGNEWVLAAQEGSAEFIDVQLPAFLSGMQNFKIQASYDAPLAEVGQIIDLPEGEWILVGEAAIAAENDPGQRIAIDVDTDNDLDIDLSDFESISFDLFFSEDYDALTDAQHLTFEYSVDGGKTFSLISNYPDERFLEDHYFDGDWFVETEFELPAEAKVHGTILRWAISETKGDVVIRDIELHAVRAVQKAPYFAVESMIPIALQRVEITEFDQTIYCHDSEIEIFYNIRGSFGADVELTLWADGAETDIVFLGITQGAGSVIVDVADLDADGEIQLHFRAEDESFQPDYPVINVVGDLSNFIEVVPEINEGTNYEAANAYSCEATERFMVIMNPQDYFMYQVRDAITHDMLSDAVVYDPEVHELPLEISIGVIESKTKAEVVVNAFSIDGTVECEFMVIDEWVEFDIRNFVLQYRVDGEIGAGYWKDYTGEEEFILCEESNDLELRIYNISEEEAIDEDIRWYRDNMNTPLSDATDNNLNYFPVTGYFYAVVKDDFCDDFMSVEVFVTVEEPPVKPLITFVGEYEICEGETAMLVTSEDYGFYRWYKGDNADELIQGANTNTLVIYEGGNYLVEVSNHAFDPYGSYCSNESDVFDVALDIYAKPAIPIYFVNPDDRVLCEPGVARVIVNDPLDDVMYQLFDINTGELSGEAIIGFANPLVLTSGELQNNANLGIIASRIGNHVCDGVSVDTDGAINIKVYNLTIIVSGNTLMASIPNADAVSYQWFRNGAMIMTGGNNRTLTIYDDAEYTVMVETIEGCLVESTTGKDNVLDPDADATASFNLFPNPVQDKLTVQFGNIEGDIQVRIISLTGEVIEEISISTDDSVVEKSINVENLKQGIYLLQVIGSDHTEVKRFIKN